MATIPVVPFTGQAAVSLAQESLVSLVHVEDGRRGAGSGVIVDPRGVIVTNAHVVRGNEVTVVSHNGMRHPARVEARDDGLDLAALRVESDGLQAARFGDSQSLRVGELVLAIGHPYGLSDAVSIGIVSRVPTVSDQRELIASNVTLNPGNSGGSLLDAAGNLVGINAMVAAPGLGLSIPIHVVRRFLARHVDPRPHIGVSIQRVEPGLIVLNIQPESPAEAVGMLPGDVIVSINGHDAISDLTLIDGLLQSGVGGTVGLRLERAGHRLDVDVAVVARA